MIVLEPRQVNEVSNLGWVLSHWRNGEGGAAAGDEAPRSKFGNINIDCTPHASPSLLLPPSDAAFFNHVEPGVRQLVAAFIELGLLTYTSCEGHNYESEPPDERHVGLVLRNEGEKERVLRLWHSVARSLRAVTAATSCDLGYMDHGLKCGDRRVRALDLYIVKRRGAAWADYFRDVDAVSAEVAGELLSRSDW